MPKILLVDDNTDNLDTLESILKGMDSDCGMELYKAMDGETALELIKSHKPNLVLMDAMAPELSGYDVCNIVKNTFRMKDVTFILMTSQAEISDWYKGMEMGADHLISVPFSPDEIMDKAWVSLHLASV